MTLLRLAILAVAIALGTVVAGWWAVPVVAAAHGVLARGTRRPGLVAALAAATAWGGYLSIVAFGGAPVGRFAGDLAQAMQVPGWAPHLATMLFPALLAGPASYLAAVALRRRPATESPARRKAGREGAAVRRLSRVR